MRLRWTVETLKCWKCQSGDHGRTAEWKPVSRRVRARFNSRSRVALLSHRNENTTILYYAYDARIHTHVRGSRAHTVSSSHALTCSHARARESVTFAARRVHRRATHTHAHPQGHILPFMFPPPHMCARFSFFHYYHYCYYSGRGMCGIAELGDLRVLHGFLVVIDVWTAFNCTLTCKFSILLEWISGFIRLIIVFVYIYLQIIYCPWN